MKILIINLTRMGDIVQSSILANALKRRYPGAVVDFVVMFSFATILKNCPAINTVHTINDTDLFSSIEKSPLNAWQTLNATVQQLNSQNYDLLVNPVVSVDSSLLTFAINAKQKLGIRYNSERRQVVASPFAAFHLANEHNLGDHGLNSVDIFAGTGGVKASFDDYALQPSAQGQQMAQQLLQRFDGGRLIGFHIGASQNNKAWETDRFFRVMKNLLADKRNAVILFGGYSEQHLSAEFDILASPRFLNLIGKLNLDELVAALGMLNLFITNDTGPMHLAAAQKVPIVNISLGPVSLWETGPYAPNAAIVKANIDCHPCAFDYTCPHLNCHRWVSPDSVLQAVAWQLNDLPAPKDLPQVNYYQTGLDCYGFWHPVPAVPRQATKKEWLFEHKRALWGALLSQTPLQKGVANYLNYLKQHYTAPSADYTDTITWLNNQAGLSNQLATAFAGLQQQANQGDTLRQYWAGVQQLKADLFAQARTRPEFFDFFHYTEFLESALEHTALTALAKATAALYQQLGQVLSILAANL